MIQDDAITAERVRILYERSRIGIGLTLVAAFIIAYIFRNQLALPLITTWLCLISAISMFRYWLLFDYNRKRQTESHHGEFENRFAYAAGLIGICWAFFTIWGLNHHALEYRLYTLLLLAALLSLAVQVFSSSLKTIYFYLLPPVVVAIPLIFSLGEDQTVLGIAASIFAAMLFRTSQESYKAQYDTLALHLQSDELTEGMKQLQYEKSEIDQRMQGVMDNTPAIIYVKDIDGRFSFVNQEFLKLLNLQRTDIIGKTPYDIFPKEIADEMHRNDVEVQESKKPLKYEESAPDDNGVRYYISIKFPLVDEAGKVYAVGDVSTDITERTQMEESLRIEQQRLLLHREQSPLGVIEWNTEFEFLDWNPAAEKIFGFTKDEVIGRQVTERILPESARSVVNKIWADLMANKGGTYSLNENITKDGRTILCEWHNTPLVDYDGKVIGVTSLVDDATERVATEQAQMEKEKAEASSQAKSLFLANMSHEIRTPLNAVLGMANIGIKETSDAKGKETFSHILDAGRHLLGVINDILEFSKIEAGKLSVESREFQLVSTIENTVHMMLERAQNKGLKLSVNLPSNLPGWVLGDPLRLQQILLNLLSNAIKFTAEGEVLVSVSRDDSMTYFKITDTGLGLNEEQISRLFTPFEQADKSTTRKFGGTGLGLTISYNLAQLMGGNVTVESKIDEGSVFTLRLPLAETKAPENGDTRKPEVSGPQLQGLRVLAAEDVELNRIILEDLLREEGASVEMAEDGKQAIDLLQQIGADQIDVVLMDLQMPVMDGYVATRHMLEIAPELPIIGITAHALKEEREKCLAAGMTEQVTKPFMPEDIINVIRKYVDLP